MGAKKRRKSIKDIQRALLANAAAVVPELDEVGEEEALQRAATEEETGCRVTISEENMADLELLAAYQGCSVESLVEMAVGDLLALRAWKLSEAREALQQGTLKLSDNVTPDVSTADEKEAE